MSFLCSFLPEKALFCPGRLSLVSFVLGQSQIGRTANASGGNFNCGSLRVSIHKAQRYIAQDVGLPRSSIWRGSLGSSDPLGSSLCLPMQQDFLRRGDVRAGPEKGQSTAPVLPEPPGRNGAGDAAYGTGFSWTRMCKVDDDPPATGWMLPAIVFEACTCMPCPLLEFVLILTTQVARLHPLRSRCPVYYRTYARPKMDE